MGRRQEHYIVVRCEKFAHHSERAESLYRREISRLWLDVSHVNTPSIQGVMAPDRHKLYRDFYAGQVAFANPHQSIF